MDGRTELLTMDELKGLEPGARETARMNWLKNECKMISGNGSLLFGTGLQFGGGGSLLRSSDSPYVTIRGVNSSSFYYVDSEAEIAMIPSKSKYLFSFDLTGLYFEGRKLKKELPRVLRFAAVYRIDGMALLMPDYWVERKSFLENTLKKSDEDLVP